ncbi:unnamed protein product [Coffea canephora]|uniref:Uncharacterized protein n=1 Tax=Coffea canephora TaxID=49390 RepID=A0A068V2N6_COFCA|nr:unnamed protein product [Coffea canephora]
MSFCGQNFVLGLCPGQPSADSDTVMIIAKVSPWS